MGQQISKHVFKPKLATYSGADGQLLYIRQEFDGKTEADKVPIIWLTTSKGEEIPAVYLQCQSVVPTFTLLLSHGNMEDIGIAAMQASMYAEYCGCDVFLYEYSGYGLSTGKPSEENCYADIDAAYTYLVEDMEVDPRSIIAFGRSVGSGPTTWLASRKLVGGVVLVTPFLSCVRVIRNSLVTPPFDIFPNVDRIHKIKALVFIMHGRKDEIVPFEHGVTLYKKAKRPGQHLWIDDATHNNIERSFRDQVCPALKDFLELVEFDVRNAALTPTGKNKNMTAHRLMSQRGTLLRRTNSVSSNSSNDEGFSKKASESTANSFRQGSQHSNGHFQSPIVINTCVTNAFGRYTPQAKSIHVTPTTTSPRNSQENERDTNPQVNKLSSSFSGSSRLSKVPVQKLQHTEVSQTEERDHSRTRSGSSFSRKGSSNVKSNFRMLLPSKKSITTNLSIANWIDSPRHKKKVGQREVIAEVVEEQPVSNSVVNSLMASLHLRAPAKATARKNDDVKLSTPRGHKSGRCSPDEHCPEHQWGAMSTNYDTDTNFNSEDCVGDSDSPMEPRLSWRQKSVESRGLAISKSMFTSSKIDWPSARDLSHNSATRDSVSTEHSATTDGDTRRMFQRVHSPRNSDGSELRHALSDPAQPASGKEKGVTFKFASALRKKSMRGPTEGEEAEFVNSNRKQPQKQSRRLCRADENVLAESGLDDDDEYEGDGFCGDDMDALEDPRAIGRLAQPKKRMTNWFALNNAVDENGLDSSFTVNGKKKSMLSSAVDATQFEVVGSTLDPAEFGPHTEDMTEVEVMLPEATFSKLHFLRLSVSNRSTYTYSDCLLLKFLRGRKFDTAAALRTLMNYESLMLRLELQPSVGPTLQDVEEVLRLGIFVHIPETRDAEGNQILYMRPGLYLPSEVSWRLILCATMFVVGDITEGEEVQRHGFTIVADMADWDPHSFGFDHIKDLFVSIQNSYAARLRSILVVDANARFTTTFKMMRPLMTKSLADKWKLQCRRDNLKKYISKSDLPEFLGGYVHYEIDDWVADKRAKKHTRVVYRSMKDTIGA